MPGGEVGINRDRNADQGENPARRIDGPHSAMSRIRSFSMVTVSSGVGFASTVVSSSEFMVAEFRKRLNRYRQEAATLVSYFTRSGMRNSGVSNRSCDRLFQADASANRPTLAFCFPEPS